MCIRDSLVPLRSLPVDNAAIERARLESAGTGAEAGARLTVTVVNPGSEPLTDRVVRATAAGGAGEEVESDALGEAFVSAPPGGRGESSLLLRRLPASGAVRVSLAPDALPWDNQAYLVTEQPGIRRVLIVSGGETPASDPAARYLALALDPTGGHEFFQPEILGPDDRALTVPIRADAVVLLDLPRLPAPALEQLERYRADGGGILIVLGDRVDPRSYNEDLLPRLGGLELTGLQGTLDDPTTYFRLRVTDPGHPIFEGFSTTSGGSLTSARFLRVLDSKPGPGSRILAEFSGGRPALVETGSTLVFTSSFDGRWNDLPTSAAFVPLVHRMIQRLAQGGSSADRVLAGTAAERAFADEEVGTRDTSLLDPNGNRLPLERSSREGKTWLKTPELRLPGICLLYTSPS
ncbi:MAG: hypothetical protein QUU85_10970, partial [Candidatus Eisenbacteria bacterium]|nr:hypothetical protein [Candidatus Eisenbacteria bacterium]